MKTWDECTHKEKIERWENAYRVLKEMTPHERKKHWNMEDFGVKTDCGTIGCAAGKCALDPWFRRRGMKGKFVKSPALNNDAVVYELVGPHGEWLGALSSNFFGHEGHEAIFMNTMRRPVRDVMREIKEYIKELQ